MKTRVSGIGTLPMPTFRFAGTTCTAAADVPSLPQPMQYIETWPR